MEPATVLKRNPVDAELDSTEGYQGAACEDSSFVIPPCQENKSNKLFTTATGDSRETSPLSSTGSSIIRENSVAPPVNNDPTPNPPKRRKLTFAEKELQKIEKQYRDQQKAEEKARKEEEKRVKEEERRVKDDEMKEAKRKREEGRKEKRKLRDAEKQTKDEEKRKRDAEKKAKEDEKAKREKSQLRLNSFFAKPTFPSGGSPLKDRSGPSSRRSSIASIDEVGSAASVRSISVTPDQPQKSDYERAFPSFFVHPHTTIAPASRFVQAADEHDNLQFQVYEDLETSDLSRRTVENNTQSSLRELLPVKARKRRKLAHRIVSVKDLVASIHGSAIRPIDLTTADHGCQEDPLTLLKMMPVKYLRYAEDVRPPYIGTYSKAPIEKSALKLCRRPFTRALPATNYDYDSEAEWEEPEDGEDLDSEGEEEVGDEDEADDMAEFLDDDDADKSGAKRRNIMGDVQPVCTGLHWEDSSSIKRSRTVPYGDTSIHLGAFRSELILVGISWPLDPFSTSYWPSTAKTLPDNSPHTSSTTATMAPPPRIPLNTIQGPNISLPLTTTTSPFPAKSPGVLENPSHTKISRSKMSAPSKPMPPELLDDFKKAIDGSDLTKAGLIEVLKKRFPQITKGTVQDTLQQVAERTGKKESDKRWRLLS